MQDLTPPVLPVLPEKGSILMDVERPAGKGRIHNLTAFNDPRMKAFIRAMNAVEAQGSYLPRTNWLPYRRRGIASAARGDRRSRDLTVGLSLPRPLRTPWLRGGIDGTLSVRDCVGAGLRCADGPCLRALADERGGGTTTSQRSA
jgi:hypothetical protein